MPTTTEYRDRFFRWVRANKVAGTKCKRCEYHHKGYHDYQNHMRAEHPNEYKEWLIWAGLTKESE